MVQRIRAWSSRRRAGVLIAAVLLLVAIVAGAVAGGMAWLRGRGHSAGQASYPALVDTSSGGGAASPVGGIVVERVRGVVVERAVGSVAASGRGLGPVVLSAGQARPAAVVPLPVATGEPLSEAEIERILARLPSLAAGGRSG